MKKDENHFVCFFAGEPNFGFEGAALLGAEFIRVTGLILVMIRICNISVVHWTTDAFQCLRSTITIFGTGYYSSITGLWWFVDHNNSMRSTVYDLRSIISFAWTGYYSSFTGHWFVDHINSMRSTIYERGSDDDHKPVDNFNVDGNPNISTVKVPPK